MNQRRLLPLLLLIIITTSSSFGTLNNVDADAGEPWAQDPIQQPQQEPAPMSGEWQLLHANIGVSAMHMQLLPGDYVLMFDRTDTGPSNLSLPTSSSSSCTAAMTSKSNSTPSPEEAEDCTAHSVLLDLRSNALHPYPLATNPWCSSGALLPNGTLLQTGGFAAGDRVARLFDPATGWTDLPSALAARRCNLVPVLGGDDGPGRRGQPVPVPAPPPRRHRLRLRQRPRGHPRPLQPVPAPPPPSRPRRGPTELPFLRLLRPPPSPPLLQLRPRGGAGLRGGGGGGPRGSYRLALRNGTFVDADRTCARVAPTDPDPAWAVEEMPVGRVMGDMVLLPTGEVVIVNGAARGTAGWELGRGPVTRPVLYRPDAPLGERFEEMIGTTTPRMYHSAATLDSLGRVLVGGSNPHVGYVFASNGMSNNGTSSVLYPTELSLEAFLPPYMDARLDGVRPRVVAAPAEVGYGEAAVVRFAVDSAEVGGVADGDDVVKVTAVAPGFATHSFGMNQRVVELAVGRVVRLGVGVYEAEVAAPPTPGVAPPGYYLWFVLHAGVPSTAAWVRLRPLGPLP
ncbi:hypothetical protein QOZ80_9AG0671490 [Eleusine coracana subsp. coracana]|nr:hypothetical protein QOZ80_9AG0671490 [Eleusine coracana subsp. coracana]